ncbi:uncharacterized protein LOC127007104 isoform X2 [Eriocheir sinensis]|nr:uncharacterized protein LOC127007104 isoform X2 [Eriocheir sinensis]
MDTFSLALADSHAEVDLEAPAHLLDGDTIILEDAFVPPDPSEESDPRLRVALVLAASERLLGRRLRCLDEVYGQHMRRLSSVTHAEQQVLFDSLKPIITLSEQLLASLDAAVSSWDSETTCLGVLFEEDLWERYEEYLQVYEQAVRVLREKEATDEEFVALCRLRRGAARFSLLHLLHLPVSTAFC